MPTYQYKCPECGHEFEEFQSMTDEPIETCPSCGGKTRRLISGGAGLLFKGSGFYITDYRSESYNKSAKADSGKSPVRSAGSGGSESGGAGVGKKPEAKPNPTKSSGSSPKDKS